MFGGMQRLKRSLVDRDREYSDTSDLILRDWLV
jgi:hypothetical protein